jgi:hypothetical protein
MIILRDPNGDLHVIAEEGGAAPGGSGNFTASAFNPSTDHPPVLQPAGLVAFDAPVQDGVNPVLDGLFLSISDSLQLIAREEDPAPGSEVNFGNNSGLGDVFPSIALGNDATLAFLASIESPGSFGSNAIFLNSAMGTAPLVLDGDVLPGFPKKRLFASTGAISAGPAGRLAFRADVMKGNGDPVVGDSGSFYFKPRVVNIEDILKPKPLLIVDNAVQGLPTDGKVLDMGEPLNNAFKRFFIHIFFNGRGGKDLKRYRTCAIRWKKRNAHLP